MPGAPQAPSSVLQSLVAMPGAPSSDLQPLVAMTGAPSNVLQPLASMLSAKETSIEFDAKTSSAGSGAESLPSCLPWIGRRNRYTYA